MDIVHTVLDLLKVWLTILFDGIDFLNDNGGVFAVIFAFIVAIAPVIYAILTWRLVSETRKLREAQTELQTFIHENKRPAITTQSEYEYESDREEEKTPGPETKEVTGQGKTTE